MHSLLYWVSFIEITLTIIGLIFFLKLVDQSPMGVFWLFSPHFVRGILGHLINKSLPSSHHIINDLELGEDAVSTDPLKKKHLNFEKVRNTIRKNMMQLFFQAFEGSQGMMKAYLMFTIMCICLDFIGACIILQHYGNPGEEDAEVILLMICVTFFLCNAKWVSFLF